MKKKIINTVIPDLAEFVDEGGSKWVQTSADDLFEIKELNSILEAIDREKNKGEVLLARIDFQKVDKEYYDAALELQKKLKKQGELLRKVISESKSVIERKNLKLKELIEYIKKIHLYLVHLNADPEKAGRVSIDVSELSSGRPKIRESVFEEVAELPLDDEAMSKIK